MKKNLVVMVLVFLGSSVFALDTYTQNFFSAYNRNYEYNKDISYYGSGELSVGEYQIIEPDSDNDNAKQIEEHYKQLQKAKGISEKNGSKCFMDRNYNIYCINDKNTEEPEEQQAKASDSLGISFSDESKFEKVYGQSKYACALDKQGNAYCWGDGEQGEIGNGERGHFSKPQKVKTDVKFSRLSVSKTYVCGIAKGNGGVYCWGKSTGSTNLNSAVPVQI
ncbi:MULTISPECIES: RCC1 domain-containing protein [unclassified Francisella]|uniref:RCC1 domain-containing protein n=1 Tax=unclassified Francisella TaxID=2610885 RepID=UPI002E37DE20|nr:MULTISPECIES: RCC1 domain-containing protein [unclassified Francisella]MED7819169.1 RCC1 domain-containing protein [Francisella sp. 19S2-4]MED7830358.1 RCC1 domain-containing protein [Francisella sp. 19S2-10]